MPRQRIEINPDTMGGNQVIRGARIAVELIPRGSITEGGCVGSSPSHAPRPPARRNRAPGKTNALASSRHAAQS